MERKTVHLVFTCSGAADVGELTDRAARLLRQEGVAAMSCLASVGALDGDILFNIEMADCVLVLDGCPKACARRTFDRAGVHRYLHLDASQAGLQKGRSPVTQENIRILAQKAAEILAASPMPSPSKSIGVISTIDN